MIGNVVVRGLGRIARRSPSLALGAADLLAPLFHRSEQAAAAERIVELFPHLSTAAARRVWKESLSTYVRTLVSDECMRRYGPDAARSLVRPCAALETARPPLIIGFFHIGPIHCLFSELTRWGCDVLVLRARSRTVKWTSSVRYEITTGDEQRRALVFYRALQQLNEGGVVVTALDPEHGTRIGVPFLGGRWIWRADHSRSRASPGQPSFRSSRNGVGRRWSWWRATHSFRTQIPIASARWQRR